MRTAHKLTVFTLGDGTSITTRSALEARWAIFFTELRLGWKYEPQRFGAYLPDFKIDGLGYVEIKPTIDLLISESSSKIEKEAHKRSNEKFYAFVGERVSFDTVALYHGKQILSGNYKTMIPILADATGQQNCPNFGVVVQVAMNRANRAKLDHFASVRKVLELETVPELARNIETLLNR